MTPYPVFCPAASALHASKNTRLKPSAFQAPDKRYQPGRAGRGDEGESWAGVLPEGNMGRSLWVGFGTTATGELPVAEFRSQVRRSDRSARRANKGSGPSLGMFARMRSAVLPRKLEFAELFLA